MPRDVGRPDRPSGRRRARAPVRKERASRCSRACASSVRSDSCAARCEVISPTASMTAKVTRYCASATASESCGGTKKKSNRATPRKAAMTAGPRPSHTAVTNTVSRKSITMLARSSSSRRGAAPSVVRTHRAAASRYRPPRRAEGSEGFMTVKPRPGKRSVVSSMRGKNSVNIARPGACPIEPPRVLQAASRAVPGGGERRRRRRTWRFSPPGTILRIADPERVIRVGGGPDIRADNRRTGRAQPHRESCQSMHQPATAPSPEGDRIRCGYRRQRRAIAHLTGRG
jgi:hypothetical protein